MNGLKMIEPLSLLEIDKGTITAPAGCGKTHLVAQAVAEHGAELPLLVLTHTNAGVAALRTRIGKLGVDLKKARIATLDGWSLKLINSFPIRSEIDPIHLLLNDPKRDYPAIREGALNIVLKGHVREILRASYSRQIVDESRLPTRSTFIGPRTSSRSTYLCVGGPASVHF